MIRLSFSLSLALFLSINASAFSPPLAGSNIVFPSPARGGEWLTFVFHATKAGSAKLLVYNEKGSLVANQTSTVIAGLQNIRLCSCLLAPGVYVYRIRTTLNSGAVESTGGKFAVIH